MFDIKKIKGYLNDHPEHFCTDNSVSTIQDVIYFKMDEATNISYVGDYFLCDIYSREVWIVKNIKPKKYDKIRGKKISVEAIEKVLDLNEDANYHKFHRWNGYYKIPSEELMKDGN
tara:strand:- start:2945 stop:3292 length:348 start_codon:yes stop_codon:yes gene_type:complete